MFRFFSYLYQVKEKTTDIERMIMESHYLNALEIESSAQKPLAEMERDDYLNRIKTLTDTVTQLRSMLQSVVEALESVNKQSEKKDLQIERQALLLEDLKNEVRNLTEQLARMRKDRFGSSSLKTRKGTKSSGFRKSRDEDEEDYDGSKKEEAPSSGNSSDGKSPSNFECLHVNILYTSRL